MLSGKFFPSLQTMGETICTGSSLLIKYPQIYLPLLVWCGGELASLDFYTRAHLSLGGEGVSECCLVSSSSHCRQWERPFELASF